ncbi:MAG: hypothetical protein RUMPE_01087 [Eubacteriales bacterium SKADARSKE-1]|nr:hypothetical protein [Eubacteriales bacterium SKADARSKE-1]
MSLSINLGSWNSVFAVPSLVVDEHIRLAGSAQLKVLLFILRHAGGSLSTDDIAEALSMSTADVKDAMGYWVETKLINLLDEVVVPFNLEKKAIEKQEVVTKSTGCINSAMQQPPQIIDSKPRQISRVQKPDPIFVAERINSSPEINYLMQEAQIILSRPISNADSSTLLMLHDTDGLPIDVILMLIQYAVSSGKGSMKYIEKVAISWGYEEIDTVEKAEKKIRMLEKSKQAWNVIQRTLGIEKRSPTSKEEEAACRWFNEWNMSEELIKEAYDRCIDAKGKYILNYIDSIIRRWHNSGIKSLEMAKEEKRAMKTKYISEEKFSPSYNINDYFETMDTFA